MEAEEDWGRREKRKKKMVENRKETNTKHGKVGSVVHTESRGMWGGDGHFFIPGSRKEQVQGQAAAARPAERHVAGGLRSLKEHKEGLEQTELKQEVKCPMKISNPHGFSFVFRTVLQVFQMDDSKLPIYSFTVYYKLNCRKAYLQSKGPRPWRYPSPKNRDSSLIWYSCSLGFPLRERESMRSLILVTKPKIVC